MLRPLHRIAPLAVLGLGTVAIAQEPINTTAATQPGVGRLVIREQFRWLESNEGFEPGAGETTEFQSWTSVFYGLRHDFALGAELPIRALDISPGDDDLDHGSPRFLAKWRFHRADLEALDTERASLIAGVRAETDDELSLTPGFASDSNDPILGAVYTTVRGRRGFNGALVGTFASDGDPDEIRYDAAGLYRMSPEVFAADTEAGWYLAVSSTACTSPTATTRSCSRRASCTRRGAGPGNCRCSCRSCPRSTTVPRSTGRWCWASASCSERRMRAQ